MKLKDGIDPQSVLDPIRNNPEAGPAITVMDLTKEASVIHTIGMKELYGLPEVISIIPSLIFSDEFGLECIKQIGLKLQEVGVEELFSEAHNTIIVKDTIITVRKFLVAGPKEFKEKDLLPELILDAIYPEGDYELCGVVFAKVEATQIN